MEGEEVVSSYSFSFVVPCYNEEFDIVTTLKACLSQNYNEDYEVIAVDDCSSDGTLEILRKFEREYSNLSVIKNTKNMGVAYSRNRGIEAARGDVIIFINADELPERNFLNDINKHYVNGADYVFPQTVVNNTNHIYSLYREAYRRTTYYRENLVMWSQGFSCKKELLKKVNMFDERYPGCGGEDWDLVSKIDKLSACRVVDYNIVVKHNLPEKLCQIVWHMYNRGRGTAYYRIFNSNINRRWFFVENIAKLSFFSMFIYLSEFSLIVMGFYILLNLFYETIKLTKAVGAHKKFIQIMFVLILNKLVRGFGYYITIIKHKILE